MPNQVTNYKCPNCTGPTHFETTSGKLECEYCGSVFDLEYVENFYKDKNEEATENFAKEPDEFTQAYIEHQWGEDAEHIRVYSCPSCSAELICDDTTAATSCPYCNNPTIVPGQLSGSLKPDFVVPFALKKEDAIEALKKHYQGKWFLPKAFKDQNHIEEIKGVYVPFWLFDGTAHADMTYEGTTSTVSRSGNKETTTTKHYNIARSGNVTIDKVPVDGSTKMPDDYMDSIEPYDYKKMQPFSMVYLPGFLADKYDVDEKASEKRAVDRLKQTAVDAMRNSVTGYETVIEKSRNTSAKITNAKYALMPVWILSTKFQDKNYLFAMNGQTGKMVGDLPIVWGKVAGLFAGIAVPVFLIMRFVVFGG